MIRIRDRIEPSIPEEERTADTHTLTRLHLEIMAAGLEKGTPC